MTTISLPQWRERANSPAFSTSATQVETFIDCQRKWWLGTVRKLPQKKTVSQTFGTVLHAVLDRYYHGDEQGKDPKTGQPVDLYPADWHVARSRFKDKDGNFPVEGVISQLEMDIIQRQIAESIKAGILRKRHPRMIEHGFHRTIVDDVSITGFIDLMHPDEVVDHKSVKNFRYAKSPAALGKSPQMLIYGNILLFTWAEAGAEMPQQVTLVHQQFCKDPEDLRVKRVEKQVTRDYLRMYWEQTIVPVARNMQFYRKHANKWDDIPNPPNMPVPCNAYGGCPFRGICSGFDDEQRYEEKMTGAVAVQDQLASMSQVGYSPASVDQFLGNRGDLASPLPIFQAPQGDDRMNLSPPTTSAAENFANRVIAQRSSPPPGNTSPTLPSFSPNPPQTVSSAPAPAFSSAPAPAQAPAQAPVRPPDAPNDSPAWADAGCNACRGAGFNTKGDPCRICVGTLSTRLQNPQEYVEAHPNAFQIQKTQGGTIVWENLKTGDGGERWVGGASPAASVQSSPASGTATPPVPAAATSAPSAPSPKAGGRRRLASMGQGAATPAAPPIRPEIPSGGNESPLQMTASEVENAESATGKGRGRPAKSFMVMVNIGPIRSGVSQRYSQGSGRYEYILDEFLEVRVGPEIAQAAGLPEGVPWRTVDFFKRRDYIASQGERYAKEFGADIVLIRSMSPGASDIRTLYEAIAPFADGIYAIAP